MRTRRSAMLLVLLFAVAFGLLGMHTLGHDLPSPVSAADSATAVHTGVLHADDLMTLPPMAQDAPAADPHGGHGMPMGTASLCLAVLAVAAITFGLILLGRPRDRAAGVAGFLRGTATSVRGPPPRRLGLRMAELSVLRN